MAQLKTIVIIGDGYVGKTSILNSIRKNAFGEQIPNVYDAFECCEPTTNNRFKIVDTAGQEEYDMLRQFSYRTADIFWLCFAINDEISFENLESKWIPDLAGYRHIPTVLIGTKSDLKNSDTISRERIAKFQKVIGALHYVECSAKTREGIEELKRKTFKMLSLNNNNRSCTVQ